MGADKNAMPKFIALRSTFKYPAKCAMNAIKIVKTKTLRTVIPLNFA